MQNEMIERVAIVLARHNGHVHSANQFKFLNDHIKEKMLVQAIAVIKAMREPTDEMKTANENIHWGYSCHTCGGLKEGWYGMIDIALKE